MRLIIAAILLPAVAHAFCFQEASKESSVDSGLLLAIARVESGMNGQARHLNRDGSTDLGLMQINSFWVDAMGLDRERLVSDSCYNVKVGAKILRQCIDRLGYTWNAVGCYNSASLGKKVDYAWKVFNALKSAENLDRRQNEFPRRPASFFLFRVRDQLESRP